MSTDKTEAIVLRAVPWSETSLVVTLWTRDYGKLSAVAKGARRIRSPFESALDLLANSSVVFIAKSGDVLDLLTEAKLIRRFRSGQQRLVNLYAGFYVAELLLRMTEEGFAIPELFDYAKTTLEDLDQRNDAGELVLRFELHALRLLGHLPSLESCVGCGEPVEPKPSIAFGAEAGGVLCSNCLPGQRAIIRMHEETRQHLIAVLESSFDRTSSITPIPSQCRREIRSVMNRFTSELQHRNYDLHPYLEDLAL